MLMDFFKLVFVCVVLSVLLIGLLLSVAVAILTLVDMIT